ncbi:hypothetical protein D3C72_1788190 [compost metagenome]
MHAAPVHGQIELRGLQPWIRLHGQDDGAIAVGDMDQIAILQLQPLHVLWVDLQLRLARMRKQPPQLTSPRHAVPLVAQAAGV